MTEQEDSESKAQKAQNLEEAPDLEKIRREINQQPGPISFEIGTCPKPTFKWFKTMAAEKYADNYGLTLTMLKERIEAQERWEERFKQMNARIERLEEDMDSLIEALNEADETSSKKDTLNSR